MRKLVEMIRAWFGWQPPQNYREQIRRQGNYRDQLRDKANYRDQRQQKCYREQIRRRRK